MWQFSNYVVMGETSHNYVNDFKQKLDALDVVIIHLLPPAGGGREGE